MENIIDIIISIAPGLITCIPLIIQLVKTLKQAAKSKNWTGVVQVVIKLMKEAEKSFDNGTEREDYVLSTIKSMEASLGFDIDENVVKEIITSIADASKTINVKTEE